MMRFDGVLRIDGEQLSKAMDVVNNPALKCQACKSLD